MDRREHLKGVYRDAIKIMMQHAECRELLRGLLFHSAYFTAPTGSQPVEAANSLAGKRYIGGWLYAKILDQDADNLKRLTEKETLFMEEPNGRDDD